MAGVDGLALSAIGAGSVFLFAGIKGKTVLGSVQALIQGRSPASSASANAITDPGRGGAGGGVNPDVPAGKGSYSQQQVADLWVSNGGSAATAQFAARVAMAESGGSATVTSSNPDGGTNVGVFQLDTKGVGAGYSVAQLQNANLNTQITIMATKNGTDWREWGDPVTASVGYHYTPQQ